MAEQETSWLKDPQHWQIILGTLAKAIAGEHQQSWQAQLGGTMAQMGQAQKMAQAEEARRAESKTRWEQLFGKLSGGEAAATAAAGKGMTPAREEYYMGALTQEPETIAGAGLPPGEERYLGANRPEDMRTLQWLLGGGFDFGEAGGMFPGM